VASCVISGAAISEAYPTPSTTGDTQRRDAALALRVEDARKLAARSQCLVRVIRRDGTSSPVTLALVPHRIDVSTEDDIIVDIEMVGGAPPQPHG
jgi:hypothetical protein